MKRLLSVLLWLVLLWSMPALADTQDFNTWGPTTGVCCGNAALIPGNSVTFPGFYLVGDSLQVNSPGWFGATNYELGAGTGWVYIWFNSPQSSFSVEIRDFLGYQGMETIVVYGTDYSTVLNTYYLSLGSTIVTFADPGESAPIGLVEFSPISGGLWSGMLQSVTYTEAVPEPGSLVLLGTGLIGLAGVVRRKLTL